MLWMIKFALGHFAHKFSVIMMLLKPCNETQAHKHRNSWKVLHLLKMMTYLFFIKNYHADELEEKHKALLYRACIILFCKRKKSPALFFTYQRKDRVDKIH